MSTEIDPNQTTGRRHATRIALVIVIAGLLLSVTVLTQFGADHELAVLLWCLALAPYLIGLLAVRLIRRPAAAVFGLLAGFFVDLGVRSLALSDPASGWTGVALMFWPFVAVILVLITTAVFSVIFWLFGGGKKQNAASR